MTRRKDRVVKDYPRCAVPKGVTYVKTGVVNPARKQVTACIPSAQFDRMVAIALRNRITLATLLRRYVAEGLEAENDREGR